MIFDTHAHYDDRRFDADRDELLSERLGLSGIDKIMNVAADSVSVDDTDKLSLKYPNVYGTLGLHPSEIKDLSEDMVFHIKELVAKNRKIRAVGEIGLDYHYDDHDVEMQKRCFVRQIRLAGELGLPVVVHSRDASRDTMEIIREHYTGREDRINGVIHCFSYSAEEAKKYIDLGFVIGVGGVVTYKNGRKLKEVVKAIPLEKIVVETDCPYLAPEPFRGQRNSSEYLRYVIDAIAAIKGKTKEDVEKTTYDTAMRLYGLT